MKIIILSDRLVAVWSTRYAICNRIADCQFSAGKFLASYSSRLRCNVIPAASKNLLKNPLTCKLGCTANCSNVLTTPRCPLLTAIWSGVCRRRFLALRSAPAAASTFRAAGSSPNAAWCAARSPSRSSASASAPAPTRARITSTCPFCAAACEI